MKMTEIDEIIKMSGVDNYFQHIWCGGEHGPCACSGCVTVSSVISKVSKEDHAEWVEWKLNEDPTYFDNPKDSLPYNGTTEFSVDLISAGDNKLSVIKKLREINESGLSKACEIVRNSKDGPSLIMDNVSPDGALWIKEQIEGLGGEVFIR